MAYEIDRNPEELDVLVRRVQAGDREAFGRLFEATQRELRIFLSAHASSLDMVDEVMQAAYVACFREIRRYEPRRTFLSWLKGIARNFLLKELRERARHVEAMGDALDGIVLAAGLHGLETEGEEGPDSERRLRTCLDRLQPHSRDLLRRRYEEKASIGRIARLLKRTESWVAVTLFRIREALRTCLTEGETA